MHLVSFQLFFVSYLYHPHESAMHTKVFKAIISYSVVVLLQGVTIFSSCFSFFSIFRCRRRRRRTSAHEPVKCGTGELTVNFKIVCSISRRAAIVAHFRSVLLLLPPQRPLIETHDKFR